MIAASLILVTLAALGGFAIAWGYRDRRDAPDGAFVPIPRRVRRLRGNGTRRTLPFVADGDAERHSRERGETS